MINEPMWHGTDKPKYPGTYAVEVYFGWKLLEWRGGEWWHPDCVGRWGADEALQWVGPLPPRRKDTLREKLIQSVLESDSVKEIIRENDEAILGVKLPPQVFDL